MIQNTFTARTLNKCLNLASQKLDIEVNNIKYEIIEQKKGIFRKKVTILVNESELTQEEKKKKYSKVKIDNSENNLKKNIDGSIQVRNGSIIIKDPEEYGRPATISSSDKVRILVDGIEIEGKKEVYEINVVDMSFVESKAERVINITSTPDLMEAYASVKYTPEDVYELKDTEEQKDLKIDVILKEQKYPVPYTIDDIKKKLISHGIKVGLIEENLKKLTEINSIEDKEEKILIAKGIAPIDSTDDKVHIKFDTNDEKKFKKDKNGNIDYKSIGRIEEVKEGEVLAIIETGSEGKDGIDVKGGIKKHIPRKEVLLNVGQGCEFQDENTVVATIEGKPSLSGGEICVTKVHCIEKNVDIATGNIDFTGDIVVYGTVTEGMEVNCGHNLTINKNVESAKLYSKQDIDVIGNVINSEIYAGGKGILKLNKLNILKKLSVGIPQLITTIQHVKKFNLLGKSVRDREIVKVLLENKFKYLNDICKQFIELIKDDNSDEEKLLARYINEKLLGCAPLNIKVYQELNTIVSTINKVNLLINSANYIAGNMSVSYCQDSILKCSGDIVITGKGEYISNIISYGNVEFASTGSIARGGIIKAENEIKCKVVGSKGGVSTKLIVGAKGHIWVDKAYQNTRFIVGEKEYILEIPSKDIHVYLSESGELIVDKFVL